MYRKDSVAVGEWIKNSNKALLITAARQIGKTWLIRDEISKSSNVFRLFSSDIGLLTSAYPAETKVELINKNGEVNNGAHFKNAVVQQLTANGFEPYFCKKSKMGEMDFVIEMSGKVVPIEVKSGKSYKTHKALDNFKDSKTGTGLLIKNACI